jgi:hypothetical protein
MYFFTMYFQPPPLPRPQPRFPPYPGGTPTGGGGGTPSSGPGAPSAYVPLSNGGVFARSKATLFPVYNASDNRCEFMAFDPAQGNNDAVNPSSYNFRVEEIAPYRTPTIRKVILSYFDLGEVELTLTLTGCNDLQEVVSKSATATLGNDPATNGILTQKVDMQLTAMNQQLNITRAANAGPLSLIKATLVGEYEENKL